ncbi:hypothetical protein ATKI12_3264 [Kitasatospora sp. Ki12]
MDWKFVAAAVAAAAALLGWILNTQRHRTETIDAKVKNAVDGAIGRIFQDFRNLESESKEALHVAVSSAAEEEKELRRQVEDSRQKTQELSEILSQASAIIPHLRDSAPALPGALLIGAKIKSKRDPNVALAYLAQLRATDASSAELEIGGDISRDLGARSLAAELYELAASRDSSNACAAAALARVKSGLGALSHAEAKEVLTKIALDHPRERFTLSEVFNFLAEVNDQEAAASLARKLLRESPQSAFLWRNLAVALKDTRAEGGEIEEAFDHALEIIGLGESESGDMENVAAPYARILIRKRDFTRAESVLRQGLEEVPNSTRLLLLWADLEIARGDAERALECCALVKEIGDAEDDEMADLRISRLGVKDRLKSIRVL